MELPTANWYEIEDDSDSVIAIRIKDGIFIGNQSAASDRELLHLNKITHVLNCASEDVPNYFSNDPTLSYLSFPWKEDSVVPPAIMFDAANETISKTIAFIDSAQELGECVMIHSRLGVSRSPALLAAYFIVKYGWRPTNALNFIIRTHSAVSIQPYLLSQVHALGRRFPTQDDIFDKSVDESALSLDSDQWMLRNTLLNCMHHAEQSKSKLYLQCKDQVDVGIISDPGRNKSESAVIKNNNNSKRKAERHISFVDTMRGSKVDSVHSSPIIVGKGLRSVEAKQEASATFIGAQGVQMLQKREVDDSEGRSNADSDILFRRLRSPCTNRLVTDLEATPSRPSMHTPVKSATSGSLEREAGHADPAISEQAPEPHPPPAPFPSSITVSTHHSTAVQRAEEDHQTTQGVSITPKHNSRETSVEPVAQEAPLIVPSLKPIRPIVSASPKQTSSTGNAHSLSRNRVSTGRTRQASQENSSSAKKSPAPQTASGSSGGPTSSTGASKPSSPFSALSSARRPRKGSPFPRSAAPDASAVAAATSTSRVRVTSSTVEPPSFTASHRTVLYSPRTATIRSPTSTPDSTSNTTPTTTKRSAAKAPTTGGISSSARKRSSSVSSSSSAQQQPPTWTPPPRVFSAFHSPILPQRAAEATHHHSRTGSVSSVGSYGSRGNLSPRFPGSNAATTSRGGGSARSSASSSVMNSPSKPTPAERRKAVPSTTSGGGSSIPRTRSSSMPSHNHQQQQAPPRTTITSSRITHVRSSGTSAPATRTTSKRESSLRQAPLISHASTNQRQKK